MTEDQRRHAIQQRLLRRPSWAGSAAPIATGFEQLDAALGGGLPRGRIVELSGPPSCGKTTLALQTVSRLQRGGLIAAWIDADRAFDPAYAAALGVSLEGLALAQPESAEQAMEIAAQLAASAAVDLVVIDSVAALPPQLELLAPVGESGPGVQARALASGLRKLAAQAARAGSSALLLNQTRGRADFGDVETTAGGPALKMYASARIALFPADAGVRFRVVKNKVTCAFRTGEIKRSTEHGFAQSP